MNHIINADKFPSGFIFHEDAGHGWLEVPYTSIIALKLENLITGYSYQHGDMIYLEEDCDAPLFIKSYLLHIGRSENDYQSFKAICTSIYDGTCSPIRSYRHYQSTSS